MIIKPTRNATIAGAGPATLLALGLILPAAPRVAASEFTFVPIPHSNSIRSNLISTFPAGIFRANNFLDTPFRIPGQPETCGFAGQSPCNFYDGFGHNGSGQSITMQVNIPHPTLVYTLMNAYTPTSGQQLATVTFVGSAGAIETFPLIAGENIRDFFQGGWANTLNNGVPGVIAVNAFTCVAPLTCLGAAGTGDVLTGSPGTYLVDEQQYALDAAFASQNLVQITITDTDDGPCPILLGITVRSTGERAPAILVFSPLGGSPGVSVTIGGYGFIDAQSVTFNGVLASFKVDTAIGITASVPAGATTGPIQVTTSDGTATSVALFTVP